MTEPQTYERTVQATDDDDFEIGELQVAEYLLFLLAFDTYAGHLADNEVNLATNSHGMMGLKLLKTLDMRDGVAIEGFLIEKSAREVSKKTIARTFRVRVSNPVQAARRALTLRTVLTRGGATTINAIFDVARARKAVKSALAAHILDDPAAALGQYAAVPLQNVRLKAWIRKCVVLVQEGGFDEVAEVAQVPSAAVESAVGTATNATSEIVNQQLLGDGQTQADGIRGAQEAQAAALSQVQEDATAAAREMIELAGESDDPPTRSEVMGIATAAAVAALSDSGDSDNVPEALRALDPEQRAAALTDGRVLVAAGAGAGKSFTLVRRVQFLVQSRGVDPSRILVSSFNKVAADELQHKISKALGAEAVDRMTVGTLHGTFRGAILKYGTPEEQSMFREGFVGTGAAVARAVNGFLRKCNATYDSRTEKWTDAEVPSASSMMMFQTRWAGNDISPQQAMSEATSDEEMAAAKWYELYLGFKGDMGPSWSPPRCSGADREAQSVIDRFDRKHREKGGQRIRLGTFDDMISVFRDILRRSPEIRQRAQKAFDHIMIDEAQDLNAMQAEVMAMLTEHIGDGSDGKSFWMIGDPDQSVYSFRGARPELFVAKDGAEGWTTRLIRTNYRCPPEVVEHANRLIAHNSDRLDKEANPNPSRSRGESSIVVRMPDDEAQAAIETTTEIKAQLDAETAEVSDFAVLCRTNKELHAYETALLMRGVPYARKGSASFLGAPETKAFLGYVALVTETDAEATQKALVDVLNKPNRFFIGPDKAQAAVDFALNAYARSRGMTKSSVDVSTALRDPSFQAALVQGITGQRGGFKFDKALEKIEDLQFALQQLAVLANDENATTQDLFEGVLDMPGIKFDIDPSTGRIRGELPTTLREDLQGDITDNTGGDDASEDDSEEDGDSQIRGLGNIAFLFELAKPDASDPGDEVLPPTTPRGFWAKMQRLQERAKELRVDIGAWEAEQKKLDPEDRRPPPGVYLGTAHSTKGAQWPTVYVQMPHGLWPMKPREKSVDRELTLEEQAKMDAEIRDQVESERRLAYVALTRPSETLRVISPARMGNRPAGLSSFITEAGLTMGENVEQGVSPDEGTPKTAWAEDIQQPGLDWKAKDIF